MKVLFLVFSLPAFAAPHFLFVKGIFNEAVPGYLTENIEELKRLGAPSKNISIFAPRTSGGLLDNIGALNREVIRSARGEKSVVIIGHSKGAPDVLGWAIYNLGPMQKLVKDIFLIQGVFGGTPVADLFMGEGRKPDSLMRWDFRLLLNAVFEIQNHALYLWNEDALSELTTRNSTRFWDRKEKQYKENAIQISDRVHYITSRVHPSETAYPIRATAWYLETYFGKNDGLTLESKQSLSWVGKTLINAECEHTDFTNARPVSLRDRSHRELLTRRIHELSK